MMMLLLLFGMTMLLLLFATMMLMLLLLFGIMGRFISSKKTSPIYNKPLLQGFKQQTINAAFE
jgi:uncharacterized protein YggT (Ycf19 family)